ncbi:T9SS type A sorting domain-containing protein [uncultured Bacteroides sp.]|uniref:T9SS type A sorting domain-containing protein n=1 Tax=uncultured Bacteroides sp. TaxID=162156 RepID=UPI002AAA8BE7|nr:T9SS type A sorting domain-containing protein [uncultured Bacteroides sp.]
MKKKVLLTALIALVTSFAFGQIIVPKSNETFVRSKVEQQLKGLEQNDYLQKLTILFQGKGVPFQSPGLKSSSIKQKLDSTVNRSFDKSTTEWLKSSKDEYTYDTNGRWTKIAFYDWNATTKQWVGNNKDEYTYDVNGRWATDINYKWNTSTSQWVANSKTEFTYNAQGYSAQLLFYNWEATTSQWVADMKYEFTYDVNGNCTQYLISNWNVITNQWVAMIKYEFTYDTGKCTQILVSSWDEGTNKWGVSMKYEFTYDANGKITVALNSIWFDESSMWFPYMKHEYFYDANGKLTTEILSNMDFMTFQLVPNSKDEYTYDTNGNNSQYIVSKWNTTTSQWDLYSKEISTYDLLYKLSDLIFPSGFPMMNFLYVIPTANVNNKLLEEQDYLWNNTGWDDSSKTTYYYSELNGSGINELNADELIIYPNPVSDGFRLNTSEKNVQVSIYDLSGSILLTKQLSGNEYIDVSNLSKGIYLVRVTTEKGLTTKKFIKK